MANLVQTSPFLGQVFHSNGEVDVIDELTGKFELFDDSNSLQGTVYVTASPLSQKVFTLYDTHNQYIKELTITETDYSAGRLGAKCWLSSIAFMIWSHANSHLFSKKHVLELGAGVGLGGLACATLNKALSVTITDGDITLVDVIHKNKTQTECTNTLVECQQFKWGTLLTPQATKPDVVIACDCIYKDAYDILLSTLRSLNVPSYLFNTHPAFRTGVSEFIEAAHGCDVQPFTLRYNDLHSAPLILGNLGSP